VRKFITSSFKSSTSMKKWLQTLMPLIDSRKRSDQSSFRIRRSLSKTKQNSSIDYRLCRTNWKRTSIDTQSTNDDDICKHQTWRRSIQTYFNSIE
jgi:hypothetical protein